MVSESGVEPSLSQIADRRDNLDRRAIATANPLSLTRRQGRRTAGGRRPHEKHDYFVDRYPPLIRLLSVGVLILCNVDAFLTLHILSRGGNELNPVMDALLQASLPSFFYTKLLLTALGLVLLVVYYHYRWFRIVKVSDLLYASFIVYCALILYELRLIFQL